MERVEEFDLRARGRRFGMVGRAAGYHDLGWVAQPQIRLLVQRGPTNRSARLGSAGTLYANLLRPRLRRDRGGGGQTTLEVMSRPLRVHAFTDHRTTDMMGGRRKSSSARSVAATPTSISAGRPTGRRRDGGCRKYLFPSPGKSRRGVGGQARSRGGRGRVRPTGGAAG